LLADLATTDPRPSYETNWDLSMDLKLDDGVIYMATLNPKEPACFVVLGMVTGKLGEINLARKAFKKAIEMGSPQAALLQNQIEHLKKFQVRPFGLSLRDVWFFSVMILIGIIFFYYLYNLRRKSKLEQRSFKS
jgi:hypothetical protein